VADKRVRQTQEALKNQEHVGPIDGALGPQTRQAFRAVQSSNGLKQVADTNTTSWAGKAQVGDTVRVPYPLLLFLNT
jgi:peptidoglycan hydrolase-like protein with peptidoglycan-binding domain